MKRTKEWWARLTKEERSRLCQLEKAGYGKGSSLLPDDCVECPICSTPHSGYGICPVCSKELSDLLDKADGKTSQDMKNKPNPGSDEAIEIGCTCPVLNNAHGRGDAIFGYTDNDGNPCFWIDVKCPIHGTTDGNSDKEH